MHSIPYLHWHDSSMASTMKELAENINSLSIAFKKAMKATDLALQDPENKEEIWGAMFDD